MRKQAIQNFSPNNNFIYGVKYKQVKLSDSKKNVQEFPNENLNIS